MKLCNILLTTAIFLTVGIVSAATWYDAELENSVYSVPDAFENDTHKTKVLENPDLYGRKLYVKVSDSNLDANGYTITLFDIDSVVYTNYNHGFWSETLPKNFSAGEILVDNFDEYAPGLPYVKSADSIGISIYGPNSSIYESYSWGPNSDGQYFTVVSSSSIAFNDPSKGIHATITFGQPLPPPVVTLLIALGLGAAFVLYRNRKQVKA